MKIDVSIIVPFYQRAKNFEKIYSTVLNQTLVNWELILVDDASTDVEDLRKSVNIANDSRIKLFCFEENQGGAVARNKGIIESKGKYIAFLDSDDFWIEDKLEKQISHIEKNNSDIVFCDLKVVDNNLKLLEEKNVDYNDNEDVSNYIFVKDGIIQTSSLLIKSQCVKDTLFNPVLRRHQDYDLVLRLYKNGYLFSKVNEPLVYWVNDGNSVISRGAKYSLCVNWLRVYKEFMTSEASINYASKILFWMARNDGNRIKYFYDVFEVFGLVKSFYIISKIFIRVLRKVFYDCNN
ncbi:glycosyltransferase family 2 protein [Vibrio aphrogenes]|uniref:glycosyltransferase family 2 protein n=1 Tax=Vibrio aphrogenes TaxID=1891186 RepID=UPI000B359CD6|nr:glycosyltransferase family 2 protein [Vibrio aphrogenes]